MGVSAIEGHPDTKRDEAPPAPPAFGCIIYDNQKEPDLEGLGGWASLGGSEPYRVRQASDLKTDAIWITSTDWNTFSNRGQNRVHNLRRLDFLRASITHIVNDFGYSMDGQSASKNVVLVSNVANRVARLVSESYRWERTIFTRSLLTEDIQTRLPKEVAPPSQLAMAFLSSFQKDSQVNLPYAQGKIFVALRRNRLRHAKEVLACPIPDGAWSRIPAHKLPLGNRERIDFVLSHVTPVLTEVSVESDSLPQQMADLVAFGVSASKRAILRKWASHPELVWLTKFVNVKIGEVYECESYRTLPPPSQLPKRINDDPLMALSYSAGLLAENHWSALASDRYVSQLQTYEVSSRAVWLRAADRALSFALALAAMEEGFAVNGYGHGSVRVKIDRVELPHLMEFALTHGLQMPVFQNMAGMML